MIWKVGGSLLLVCGVALGGVGAWQVWGTDIPAATAQREAIDTLTRKWQEPQQAGVAEGEPVAVLRIPRLGADWSRVVVEGVAGPDLDRGPGHYPGTAQPGEVGNLAIAGHRVGNGAPFNDLNEMQPCDPIEVDTATTRFTYRVLPERGGHVDCGLPVVDRPGLEIVSPERGDLVLPVPAQSRATPTQALLTLTTCHPRYSARQRLVVQAILMAAEPRAGSVT